MALLLSSPLRRSLHAQTGTSALAKSSLRKSVGKGRGKGGKKDGGKRGEAEGGKGGEVSSFGEVLDAMKLTPASAAQKAPQTLLRGVTIKWLVDFTNRHKCWSLPTYQVVEDIVKPATKDLQCRFVDLASVKASGAVGEAKVFVSHAWGASWGSLVAACNHGTNQTLRVWVDVLAIAQWPGAKQKNDLQDLESCVAFSSALLLVVCVHPAIHAAQRGELPIEVRQQIPFDRIWCLLEIYAAHKTQTPIVMKLGNVKDGTHKMWQPEEEWGIIDRLLAMVDVSAARAKFEEDRVRILEEVKKIAHSFSRADSIIRGAIVGAAWGARLPEVQAAACGELKALQAVFKKYPNLEKRGVTPLVSAAASGHLVVVKELLKMGAVVNKVVSGVTPLWVTAQGGHVKVLMELLRQGADVTMRDPDGRNAIMIAAEGGHHLVVKLLLGQNADIRLVDYRGRTAAFMAAERGHMEVLQDLLRAGSPMNTRDVDGRSMMLAAAEEGHVQVVEHLIRHANKQLITGVDGLGRSPVFVAAQGGHFAVLEALLENGADGGRCDLAMRYPVAAAAAFGHDEIVKLLLDHAREKNDYRMYQDDRSMQLLVSSVQGGNPLCLKLSMEAGVRPTARKMLDSMATLAVVMGHSSVLQMLLPFAKHRLSIVEQSIGDIGAETICELVTGQVGAAVEGEDSLTALDLSACNLEYSGIAILSRMLTPDNRARSPPLSYLQLDRNRIGPKGTKNLVDSLCSGYKNRNLTFLSLSRNDIGEKGAQAVARLLRPTSSAIKSLDLWWNDLGPEGTFHICKAIAPSREGSSSSLSMLNLENNCIDDIGAQAIADALAVRKTGACCNLTHLDLTSNEITGVGAQALSSALCPSEGRPNTKLQLLLMPDNAVQSTGAIALSRILYKSAVHTLDLADNDVNVTGAEAIGLALTNGPATLTDLNLAGNSIGGGAIHVLANSLAPQHKLRRLNLSRCKLSFADVHTLAATAGADKVSAHRPSARRKTLVMTGHQFHPQEVSSTFAVAPHVSVYLRKT